ncbi:hypothetical protein PENTCL1PPCAC_18799 [Pristionchus entomophagus]|uniref:CX domain-containing protein n=1 Tax=Pristionchus entomophagus TaxID=358040 RepID=A0AAV5TRN7_9BILA|nr:hypothetical protein PENTCL1PPCAC_18799 [Pristionchus entomophagus]
MILRQNFFDQIRTKKKIRNTKAFLVVIKSEEDNHSGTLRLRQTRRSHFTHTAVIAMDSSFYAEWIQQRQTPKCFESGPQCITTSLYYFECCEDDCCTRVQPLVKIVILIITVAMILLLFVKAFLKIRTARQTRQMQGSEQSLLSEVQKTEISTSRKGYIAIRCW